MVTKDGWEFGAFRLAAPTHDTPEASAALAAALRDAMDASEQNPEVWLDYGDMADFLAKTSLAALDEWTLVPRVATADWTGSTRKDAEIARLRAALKAGVEIVTAVTEWGGNCGGLPQTLQDRADWWRLDVDPVLEARQ